MRPVKRTRRRSSGTFQALASQLSIGFCLRLLGRLGLFGLRRLLLRLLFGGDRLRLALPHDLRLRLAAQPGDRPARLLDLLAGGLGEGVRRDRELLPQLSVAEALQVEAGVADQARRDERLRGDLGTGVEALEVADVDRIRERAMGPRRHRVLRVRAALLAEAHVDRHLAALEAGAHLRRAGPRLLALDPAPGVAPLARAEAAADALAVAPLLGGLQVREVEIPGHGCLLGLLHPDEVADLSQHTRELRALLLLDTAADLAEAERPQRAAVARGLADLATSLCDLQLRHLLPSPAELVGSSARATARPRPARGAS